MKRIFLSYFFIFLIFKENKISEYVYIFKKIANNYKIYTDEIMLKPFFNFNNKKFLGFYIVSSENEQNKKEIKDTLNSIKKNSDSIEVNNEIFINDKLYKNISLKKFYDVVVEYFDNYLKKTYCIEYVCKQKEIYDNIFKQLEKMSKKNDWSKFHPQEFK